MARTLALAAVAALALALAPRGRAADLYAHLAPFTTTTTASAGAGPLPTPSELLASIHAAIAGGEPGFTVPPGLYNFSDASLFPDAQISLAYNVSSPFALACAGVLFLLRPGQGMAVTNVTGLSVTGLTVDMYPLPFTQGVVSDVYRAPDDYVSYTLTLDDGFPDLDLPFFQPPATSKTIFWNRTERTIFHAQAETTTTLHNATRLSSNPPTWRVATWMGGVSANFTPPSAGALSTVSPVLNPALACTDCADSLFEDVTLYASSAMGYVEAGGGGGNVLRRWRSVRPNDSSRLIATNLDAVHSTSVSRGITFVDSEVSFAADDLFAVHCELGIAWGVPADAAAAVAAGPSSPSSLYIVDTGGAAPTVALAQPGQTLYFYALNATMDPLGTGVVKAVTVVANATLQAEARNASEDIRRDLHLTIRDVSSGALLVRVDFDGSSFPLPPPSVSPRFSSMVELRERCGDGTVVRNVSLHDSTGGMRLKGANVTVDSVTLARAYGMRMLPEVFWTQSVSQDVLVENSVLIGCGGSPAQADPIAYANDTCGGCVLRNNTFLP